VTKYNWLLAPPLSILRRSAGKTNKPSLENETLTSALDLFMEIFELFEDASSEDVVE
jgi:hypothetical protein